MPDLTPLEAAKKHTEIARNLEYSQTGEAFFQAIHDAANDERQIAAGELRPVVHAKSVFVNNGKVERWCSRCNHIIPKYADWCPFCGALMDGKDDSHAAENA